MKRFALVLLCVIPAFAADKPKPVYSDAILKSFRTAVEGEHCTTTGNTTGTVNADTNGNTTTGTVNGTTNASTSCSPHKRAYYTIQMGENTFELTPKLTGKETTTAVVTLGWGALFMKDSSLYGVLPGTPVKVWSDGGTFHVKVGKRESLYKLVSAQ